MLKQHVHFVLVLQPTAGYYAGPSLKAFALRVSDFSTRAREVVSGSRRPQGRCHHSLCQPTRDAHPIPAYSAFLPTDSVGKRLRQMPTVDWTPDFKSLPSPALVRAGSVSEAEAVT